MQIAWGHPFQLSSFGGVLGLEAENSNTISTPSFATTWLQLAWLLKPPGPWKISLVMGTLYQIAVMPVDDDIVGDTQGEMPVEAMPDWQERFSELLHRIVEIIPYRKSGGSW
jgi:hypothetical protein